MPKTWLIRSYGDNLQVTNTVTGKTEDTGTVLIKSLVWPGSLNFFHKNQNHFVYIGKFFLYFLKISVINRIPIKELFKKD